MWRENPQLVSLVEWIAQTDACRTLREIGEAHPLALLAVQMAHLIGICVVASTGWLVGLWLMRAIDLPKALGASPAVLLRAIYPALTVLVLTGLLLIVRRPDRILLSAAFYLKVCLIAAGLSLVIYLVRTLKTDPLHWEARRGAARVLGLALILIWTGVVFAGRWIPFHP